MKHLPKRRYNKVKESKVLYLLRAVSGGTNSAWSMTGNSTSAVFCFLAFFGLDLVLSSSKPGMTFDLDGTNVVSVDASLSSATEKTCIETLRKICIDTVRETHIDTIRKTDVKLLFSQKDTSRILLDGGRLWSINLTKNKVYANKTCLA